MQPIVLILESRAHDIEFKFPIKIEEIRISETKYNSILQKNLVYVSLKKEITIQERKHNHKILFHLVINKSSEEGMYEDIKIEKIKRFENKHNQYFIKSTKNSEPIANNKPIRSNTTPKGNTGPNRKSRTLKVYYPGDPEYDKNRNSGRLKVYW